MRLHRVLLVVMLGVFIPAVPPAGGTTVWISVGGADVYPWYLADQYPNVSNVPDGRYLLRVDMDAGGKLADKTHANNVAMTCIALRGQHAERC